MIFITSERHVEELELFISSLEEERRKHTNRLLKLEEERTELELQVSSLTAKLEHKTKQTDCLQGELGEVNSRTVTLERQVSGLMDRGRDEIADQRRMNGWMDG